MKNDVHVENRDTPHILNTSSNLLGLCFIVITYLRTMGYPSGSYTDRIVGLAAIFFTVSSFFSFLSMKSSTERKIVHREIIADASFFLGMATLMVIVFGNVFRIF